MNQNDDGWSAAPKEEFRHGLRCAAFVAVHTLVALTLTLAIFVTHVAFKWAGDPKLLDLFPIRYIFEAGELGVLVAFVIGGIIDAREVFSRPASPPDRDNA